jgi:ankyrin repeat protein
VECSKLSSNFRTPSKLCSAGWFGASSRGDIEMVKRYLRQGQKVDARHSYGRTALFLAAEMGLAEMVRTLLEAGANPNAVDTGMYQDTPLHRAAYHGFYSVVQALLDHVRVMAAPRLSAQLYPPVN